MKPTHEQWNDAWQAIELAIDVLPANSPDRITQGMRATIVRRLRRVQKLIWTEMELAKAVQS